MKTHVDPQRESRSTLEAEKGALIENMVETSQVEHRT
jgi:hypothetical protein